MPSFIEIPSLRTYAVFYTKYALMDNGRTDGWLDNRIWLSPPIACDGGI